MEFNLTYGGRTETVRIPDKNLLGVLTQPPVPILAPDPLLELQRAARTATEFLSGYHRILVLVNDYTRPTPNQPILELLTPELARRETKILICLGTHRPATETELKKILGESVFSRFKNSIYQHNCHDRSQHILFGKTSFGTEVWLNRNLIWADAIITINSIEPHYFAGYTGGRKAFIPGIAAYETIIHNHNLLLHPASAPLSLKENPVNEDMTEAAKMLPKPIFSIQVVQNQRHRLLSVHYGNLFQSFATATTSAYGIFALPITEKADIVLSILNPPYDINFYQSQRAVEFAVPALKPGGIQITVSSCHQGIGNDEFIKVLQTCTQPEQVLEPDKKEHPGWHKAARLAKILTQAKLYTVMGVADDIIRSTFMTPFHSIQEAVDDAIARMKNNATIYFIPDAGAVVPVIKNPAPV